MQTYFPPTINFSKMTNPINGGLYATFTFSLVFALDPRIQMPDDFPFLLKDQNPYSTVLDPVSAWGAFLESLDKESFLDYGIPKLYSEWLMAGSAYAHGQKAVSVNVNVGTLSREFLVVGDSHDTGIDMIDPTPFEKMPLTWANTYGGKAHIENPAGKGMDKDTFGIIHLPNIYEKSSIGHNTTKIPACPQGKHALTKGFYSQMGFQAYPNGMGTYNDAWVKNLFPAPPKDFDWKYYNLAQAPQIMPNPASQGAVFQPLENIRITNMHETYPEITGQIPPYNLRFFVEYAQNPIINIDAKIPHIAKDMPKPLGTWREVQTQADTLWLLPNHNMGVVMWHASVPTQSEAHIDIISLAAYLEYALHTAKDPRECISIAMSQEEGVEVKAEIPKAELAPPTEPEAVKLDLKIPEVAATTLTGATLLTDALTPDLAFAKETTQKEASPEEEKNLVEIQALTEEGISTGVNSANEVLAQMGLDVLVNPLEVEAKMAEFSAALETLNAKVPENPVPADILANTGLSPEQIDAVTKVTEIPIPFEEDFESALAYNVAFEAYISEVALIMGAPPEAISSVMDSVSALDTFQNKYTEISENLPTDTSLKFLTDAGIPEQDAKILAQALQTPFPEDASQESLERYYKAFDNALNAGTESFENSSTANFGSETINNLRGVLYGAGASNLTSSLNEAGVTIPDDQKQAFELFQSQVQDLSFTHKLPADMDLAGLAVASGITSPALLSAIYDIDPMPLKALPPQEMLASSAENVLSNTPPNTANNTANNTSGSPTQDANAPEVTPPVIPSSEDYKTPTNAEEFKQALIDEIDLSSHDITGIDLSNLDISMLSASSLALCAHLSLEGANLENAKIMKANFSKTQLSNANLKGADFSECNMTGANMSACKIENTCFEKAILDSAIYNESSILQSSFNACSAIDSSWNNVQLENSSFVDAHLTQSSWIESSLRNQEMSNADFQSASFEMTSLESCQFVGNLTQIRFIDSTLTQVNFDTAQLTKARFYTSKCVECTFNQANLEHSNWSLVSAEKTSMEKALLDKIACTECAFPYMDAPLVSAKNGIFQSCDLTGANFSYSNLFKGSLRDSVVASANFSNANLYDADLYLMRPSENTNFTNTDLTNTLLTRA